MVKLGCLILSMVEMNLVGRVNLFLLVMGWAVILIHHSYPISITLHINRLSSTTYLRGDSVEFLFNLYTCVLIMFLVASGFEINLGCYIILPEAVRKWKFGFHWMGQWSHSTRGIQGLKVTFQLVEMWIDGERGNITNYYSHIILQLYKYVSIGTTKILRTPEF